VRRQNISIPFLIFSVNHTSTQARRQSISTPFLFLEQWASIKTPTFIGEKSVPPLFIKWNERSSTLDLLCEVE
jgi:hypothetical protein